MRHNIFSYSQEVAVKLGLTLPDLLILQWMADFFPTSKVVKHKVGNKIYFWVNYEKLLKDLPILNVSKDRLYRWLKSLTDSHVLEHYTLRNQDGTFSLYRFGDNYEALLGYGDIEENVAPVESEEKPKAEKTTKKRSYSEVFEAEENVYIKEALSKWLKVCKDRGVKFNIRTVKKWAETLRKGLMGIPTGLTQLDDITNGWLFGEELVIITGRTNVGKSWIAEFFGTVAWEAGYKILQYSGEMSVEMVGFRFDTLHKHFSNMGLLNGSGILGKKEGSDGAKLLQDDYKNYISQLSTKSGYVIVTPDDFGGRKPTVGELETLAKKLGSDMIIVDQLSLMMDQRRADTPRIAYNNISEDAFLMSKKLGKPVIMLAQANREAVKNKKKGQSPELHDLAESDGVAQNATRVISLSVIDGILKLSVKKNRYGINNKDVMVMWDINAGYIKPLLENKEGEKGEAEDYGF